jgi:long-chain acyl-CoA synthetase
VVGQNIDFWVSAEYWLADRLVLSEIRRLLGGKVRRIIVVHGVPMRQTRWFFEAAGASPLQLFGRPETTGIGLCEPPDMPRPGSLGRSMAEVETSVDDTGQVFSAGRHIAEARLVILANKEKGYSAQLSACPQVQTDGRLDLGVAGELDEDGFIWAEPPLGPLDAPSLAVLPIGFADNGN